MIRVNRAMGVGALGAASVPACLTVAPGGYSLQQRHFNPGGKYAEGTPGFTWFQQQVQLLHEYLSNCRDGEVRLTPEARYYYALLLVIAQRGRLEQLEEDHERDLEETEDALSAAKDAADACQTAMATGQNCPPAVGCPVCPPPTVCPTPQQAPQQQKKAGFGANLGWIAGGAVAGAGLMYFLRKR